MAFKTFHYLFLDAYPTMFLVMSLHQRNGTIDSSLNTSRYLLALMYLLPFLSWLMLLFSCIYLLKFHLSFKVYLIYFSQWCFLPLFPNSQYIHTHSLTHLLIHSVSQISPESLYYPQAVQHVLPNIILYVFMWNPSPAYATKLYMPWRQGMLCVSLLIAYSLATYSETQGSAALPLPMLSLGM